MNQKWLSQLPIQNIKKVIPVSGGDINESYQIQTDNQKFFMKVQPKRGKAFFQHEVEGLKLLNKAANVPEVVNDGEINSDGYLILKWIDSGSGSQYELGQMVAKVHQIHNHQFGLDHDFKIGKIPKNNHWQSNWIDFYINQRLEPLVNLAKRNHVWNQNRDNHYQNLKQTFINYYKHHRITPSLLHGDLWAGNFMFDKNSKPVLIDPDVFYGDREMDLAMTTVFGGFNENFYKGYNAVYPIQPGFDKRVAWYQFNYLMAHLNLFGELYGSSVDRILNQF
ncbi:aminoglycoside phosphotransferase [Philodulcilactobacillus myokoensis]|uniref:Aminoglycoside phosphotransferase n=1 Tax=Philodulcilactobacillus myokoensis TaxID=2929573 RepID=A0A9W6B1H2_9LACO|nr:aminoglycoside phosphotransferase [Philodulcilactobacillus myokoensis]